MIRFIKGGLTFIIILIVILISLWLLLPYWITPVSKLFLPTNASITINNRPQIIKNGVVITELAYNIKTCSLVKLKGGQIIYQDQRITMVTDKLDINSQCLSELPESSSASSEPLLLEDILQSLPHFDLTITHFNVEPWSQYQGRLTLVNNGQQQQLHYHSDLLSTELILADQGRLTITSLHFISPDSEQQLSLMGFVDLPAQLDQIPLNGQLSADFKSDVFDNALSINLVWDKLVGAVTASEQNTNNNLLNLPWSLTENKFIIDGGQWSWPYAGEPLSGGMNLTLTEWNNDYSQALLAARFNIITQGHGGKSNLVVSFGPDTIKRKDNDFHVQINGKVGLANIATYINIPAMVKGQLLAPTIHLQPGALLRATGKISPDITLKEARFPLAGVSLTDDGINGRLQAIVNATHRQWGAYKVHLDGKATDFLPDRGLWRWKFWGNGYFPELKAKWDVAGNGLWQDYLVNIESMSTGFNELTYGRAKVQKPRFILTQPLIWQRDKQVFNADLLLQADKVTFTGNGYLPKASLNLNLQGTAPNNFVWNGQLIAKPIGPIRLNGRWDGASLRGEAWWPKQSLQVFQSLLATDLGIKFRDGTLYAQAAFSANDQQGFQAGGHIVVNSGSLWLKDGALRGLDFNASYLFKDHIWHLGNKEPIKLKIAWLNNLFKMKKITANLQGSYPYSEKQPLILSNVALDVLKGHISMSDFRLPPLPQQPTILKIDNIELSELFTVLKPKQIAMSGKVSGELPLYIDNPDWLVKDGWIDNSGNLTLRLDTQFVDAIIADSVVTGAAMDWLRYIEISRSRADINVSNLGILSMDSQIKGINSLKSKEKPIILNYHHEENIFQLWQSLRFGDNLKDWVEQQVTSHSEKLK